MSLFDLLINELTQRHPARGLRTTQSSSGDRSAIFPAAHPDVGDIVITEDGETELIVYVGKFTHTHHANYNDKLRGTERDKAIVASVVGLLDEIFADRIVMWGSHKGGGGFAECEDPRSSAAAKKVRQHAGGAVPLFVWSGPLA
ncbi:MAG: hypothetical protein QM783_13360 [Phycisphaerales bacterium]